MKMIHKKVIKQCTLLHSFLILLAFLLFLTPSFRVHAGISYIKDEADLLTSSEEADLDRLLRTYSEQYRIDIVVTTRNGLDGKSDKRYLEDYVDSVIDSGFYSENIVILQYDIDSRYCTIQAYGDCEFVIDDDNIEYILDVVCPQITEKQYFNAFEDFAKGVKHYYNNPKYEYGQKPFYIETWFQILLSLCIGGIVVGSMAAQSKGRNTVNNHTYLDEQHSGLVAQRDVYLRTSVTKVRKPSNNNNGTGGGRSSGGGGFSSGGRSHSGGSRRC